MSQVPPLAWLYNVDLFDNVITRDVFLNKCFTVNYALSYLFSEKYVTFAMQPEYHY